jgi:long-subunit fatty acid transport protein
MLTTKFNTQPIGRKKFLYILTILTVFFLLCNIFFLKKIVCAGSGFYLLGSGPRSTGRGGADIAVADDTFSINLNPAGMKNINGKRLDIALGPGVAQTHFENKYNDTDGDPFYFALPNVGYVNNDNKRLAYGLALSVPSGLGTSYSVNHPLYEKKSI